MSEIMSFGNLVNALNSVRDDYNEHLKTVPQYEAFLLVEGSTQRAVDTLRGRIDASAPSMAAEVISSLETAKTKFKEHLKSVPEYRALLAIDKLISDVSIDLGVQPAVAQTVSAAPETASLEMAPKQPEPDLAASTAEHAIAAPEAAAIATPQSTAFSEAEPDHAVSAKEFASTQSEAAEIASLHEVAGIPPGPDHAVSAAELASTRPEAAELGPPHEVAGTPPEPDRAASAAERTSTQPGAAEIASPHEVAATRPEPDRAVSPAEHTVTQTEATEITATPLPAAPFGEGSEKAA